MLYDEHLKLVQLLCENTVNIYIYIYIFHIIKYPYLFNLILDVKIVMMQSTETYFLASRKFLSEMN